MKVKKKKKRERERKVEKNEIKCEKVFLILLIAQLFPQWTIALMIYICIIFPNIIWWIWSIYNFVRLRRRICYILGSIYILYTWCVLYIFDEKKKKKCCRAKKKKKLRRCINEKKTKRFCHDIWICIVSNYARFK